VDFLVLSVSLKSAIESVSKALNTTDAKWLMGGSCGLALQAVSIKSAPRDLDIYVDLPDVEKVHQALLASVTDHPHFSTTEIYESCLSHYAVEGVQVEVVGGFRVQSANSLYAVEASYLYDRHGSRIEFAGQYITLMPLAHELLFNCLRKREDRYQAIAEQIRRWPERYGSALLDLVRRNRWGEGELAMFEELSGLELSAKAGGVGNRR
jgi:hypothetical protein